MKQNVRQASGIEEDATNRSACPPWRVAILAGLPWGGLGGGLPFWRFAHTAHILLSTHVVRGHVMESLAGRLDEKDVVIFWVLCLSGLHHVLFAWLRLGNITQRIIGCCV